MNQQIEEFLKCKKLALVGFSRAKGKFGNTLYEELTKRGYELYPLHKTEKEINGVMCYPDLASVKDKIEGVLINTSPKNVIPILEEAAALNIKNIWLQSGAESKEVYDAAARLKLPIITKNCMLLHAEPVQGFHKFHRVIAKLFGKL
jgi:uncharacterized protein